jgi:hypothetical protein
VRRQKLRTIFALPAHVVPLAYLCLGWVRDFPSELELEQVGWAQCNRLMLHLHAERYGNPFAPADPLSDL